MRSSKLKIVIHEQQMPAGRSRQKPCVRQHSNTMALRIFVDFWQHFLPMSVYSIENLEQHACLSSGG